MDNLSSLDKMDASKGKRLANVSSSAFNLSRCRLLGLLFPELSLGDGFKLHNKKKKSFYWDQILVSNDNHRIIRLYNENI